MTHDEKIKSLASTVVAVLAALEELVSYDVLKPRDVLGVLSIASLEWAKVHYITADDYLTLHRLQEDRAREVLK